MDNDYILYVDVVTATYGLANEIVEVNADQDELEALDSMSDSEIIAWAKDKAGI